MDVIVLTSGALLYKRAHLWSHQHIIHKSQEFRCCSEYLYFERARAIRKLNESSSLSTRKAVYVKTKCKNCSWLSYGRWIKEEMEEKTYKRMTGFKRSDNTPEWNPCISYKSLFWNHVCDIHWIPHMFIFIDKLWFLDLSLFSFLIWNDLKLSLKATHLFLFLMDIYIGGIHITVK